MIKHFFLCCSTYLTDKETRVQGIFEFGGWQDDVKMPGFWFSFGGSASCTVHLLEGQHP